MEKRGRIGDQRVTEEKEEGDEEQERKGVGDGES
jgi:hypothetical protein